MRGLFLLNKGAFIRVVTCLRTNVTILQPHVSLYDMSGKLISRLQIGNSINPEQTVPLSAAASGSTKGNYLVSCEWGNRKLLNVQVTKQ
jgi:hypothetical protein